MSASTTADNASRLMLWGVHVSELCCKIIGLYHVHKNAESISLLEMDSLEALYKSYKSLKGNGMIDDIIEQMREIPII
jgi:hypothetical protein